MLISSNYAAGRGRDGATVELPRDGYSSPEIGFR